MLEQNSKDNENDIVDVAEETKTTSPYEWAQKTARKSKAHKPKSTYMQSLCCALIIGGVSSSMILGSFCFGNTHFGNNNPVAISTTAGIGSADITATSNNGMTVSDVAKRCKSSVVSITNKSVEETIDMFGQVGHYESDGSGVIIGKNDSELIIATNYHVIEGADTLAVCVNDSEDLVFEANLKGADSENDLAVLAVSLKDIKSDVLKDLSIASFADSTDVGIGDQVVAIGNALGIGQSVTSGYVSALNKEISINGTTATLLQTDAAINPGNSGGALFNMNGELIGINTAKYSDTTVEGMGFAIPIETAQPILEKLMAKETKEKLDDNYGYLGIFGQDVDAQTSKMYSIPEGIYISQVIEGTCVEASGLQKGDIITNFDGQKVNSLSELRNLLFYYKAGTEVEITYYRSHNGEYKEAVVTVTLDNSKEQMERQKREQLTKNDDTQTGDPNQSGSGKDSEDENVIPYDTDESFQIPDREFGEFFNNFFN